MIALRLAVALMLAAALAAPAGAQSGPVASLLVSPIEGNSPLTVEFYGAGSFTPPGTTITTWHWQFGDGEESFEAEATEHTYTVAGSYTMTLTITNSASAMDSITQTIVVFAAGSIFPWQPIPSPTIRPTASPLPRPTHHLPTDDLIISLATVESNLSNMPDELENPVGALLPAQDGSLVFRYAKWLLSANIGEEMFGPFAPIVTVISFTIQLLFTVGQIYIFLYVAAMLLRFVVWLITQILKFIPFFG